MLHLRLSAATELSDLLNLGVTLLKLLPPLDKLMRPLLLLRIILNTAAFL